MKELQEINPNKEQASNAMIMFLTLNTAGFTIIPVSIIAFRATAKPPTLPIYFAIVNCHLWWYDCRPNFMYHHPKIKWDAVLTAWVVGIVSFITGLTYLFSTMPKRYYGSSEQYFRWNYYFLCHYYLYSFAFLKKINVYTDLLLMEQKKDLK